MIEQGTTAPGFELLGTSGDEIRNYRLSDQLETGPVVLAFYPQDFSPVCTKELCTLHEGDYFTLVPGVDVFGISTDGIYSHQEFASQHGLSFPLLSDGDGVVADRYGVRYSDQHERFGARVVKRSLFLIDEDQRVQYSWKTDDADAMPDLTAAKQRLDEVTS